MSTKPNPSNEAAYVTWLEEKVQIETSSQPLTWICWLCLGICIGDITTQAHRELKMRGEWKRPAVMTYFAIRFFSLMAFISAVVWCTTGGMSDVQASVWSKLYIIFESFAHAAIFAVLLLRTLTLYQGRYQARVREICIVSWLCVSLFGLVNCVTYQSFQSPHELRLPYSLAPKYGFLRICPYILSFVFCLAMTGLTVVAVRRQMQRMEDVSILSAAHQRAVTTPIITRIMQHQLIYFVVLASSTALVGGLQSVDAIPSYYGFIPNALVLVVQATLACNMILGMRFPTRRAPCIDPAGLVHSQSRRSEVPGSPWQAPLSPVKRAYGAQGYRYTVEQIQTISPRWVPDTQSEADDELKRMGTRD
ncbi:hypothetical protein IE81DRAFT_346273 [Ceraceosorus guamensis]|uniref:Uncharacterized protein n=1 Tax=Ceraceosorus guamensis TaxID=1522189 RepID=A0A316W6I5_9BASI|nr:hypothetical protein IE81DRAFT_346273 [Ceraceosorus guamensis]PWN43663.1 hypothetical protein IE81DRAFT_346273 [Ceraceosorus guamensis]